MKDNCIWKILAVLIAFVMATTCITLCIAVVEDSADKIGYLNKIELYRTPEDQIFAENEINCLSASSADVVATSDNIKLYVTYRLSEDFGSVIDGFIRFVSNGDSGVWHYYYLNGDIRGTSYSYRLDLNSGLPDRTSEISTTFKIEIIINNITVATFPLITVQYDPEYQPQTFSGTVTGLDPTTSSGDEVALKITKISGDIGTVYFGSIHGSYITIPPLAMQTIQSKIDAANPGDTIIIEDGIYNENVKVNKQLTIRSKNGPDKTIVQAAAPEDPVFNVSAGHVDISGFTAKGADTGIYLYNVDYCNISGNNCSSNDVYGIDLLHSNNNSIFNNTCSNNNFGIYLNNSSNNIITNNNVSNNSRVITIDNTTTDNNFDSGIIVGPITITWGDGISLYNSSNNKIYLNNFINNYDNVHPSDLTNIWNSQSKMAYTYNGSTYTNYLGNYWDDYKEKYLAAGEIDESGIWDTPYDIDSDKDNYPLIEPFEYYIAKRVDIEMDALEFIPRGARLGL